MQQAAEPTGYVPSVVELETRSLRPSRPQSAPIPSGCWGLPSW